MDGHPEQLRYSTLKFRFKVVSALVVAAGLAGLLFVRHRHAAPLWPGAAYTEADRDLAVRRGLHFIIDFARDPKVFHDWGADLLWCLYSIANTSADREVSQMALTAAVERAREFRRLNPVLPANADAEDISALANGSATADMLGVRDDAVKEQIRIAVRRFPVQDFLSFDPTREPPPTDLPAKCDRCGLRNARGVSTCRRCGAPLKMQNRYDIWLDALITTYTGDVYGVMLGARYRDVLRWAPSMPPYRGRAGNPEFWEMFYAATHVVYTLNDYSKFQISPACLPEEFTFLKASLPEALAEKDPESMGEFLDSLRAFGLTDSEPLIRVGTEFLLRTQNADGSWGDAALQSSYDRYHPTWTAIDGLREYRWTQVLCPDVR